MFYIIFALLLFVSSVIIHLLYCRYSSKRKLYIKAYGIIAGIFLGIYMLGVFVAQHWFLFNEGSWWGLSFKLTAGVIFVLLIPFYLTFYRHTQLMSPSYKILLTLAQRGTLSLPDIVASVQEEDFIVTRLNDLCGSKCVLLNQGKYILSPLGKKIVIFLQKMQDILGRDIGG